MSKKVETFEAVKEGIELLTSSMKELEEVVSISFKHIDRYHQLLRNYIISPEELRDMIKLVNEMDKTTKQYDYILQRLWELGIITKEFYKNSVMYESFSRFQKGLYEDLRKMEHKLVKKQKKQKLRHFLLFIIEQIMH